VVPSAIGSRKEVEIAEGIARMADRRDDHLSKGEHAQQKRSLDKLARAGRRSPLLSPLRAQKTGFPTSALREDQLDAKRECNEGAVHSRRNFTASSV
jgi:hypothetical protein